MIPVGASFSSLYFLISSRNISPAFSHKEIRLRTGVTVDRDGFVFTDIEEG